MGDIKSDKLVQRDTLRVLKRLNGQGPLSFELNGDHCSIISHDERCYKFNSRLVDQLLKRDCVFIKGDKINLTETGSALLKRMLFPEAPFLAQNTDIIAKTVLVGQSQEQVKVNISESPLSRLYYRKDKRGKSWLDEAQFNAGEKIRSDFERAGLQPSISASWSASIGNKSHSNSSQELSDFAIDSRKRLEQAIAAIGPELKDVVLDVCCYLKGLELIEKEKRWPPRSAKLLLRTALTILARHYGLGQVNNKQSQSNWGSDQYRPTI